MLKIGIAGFGKMGQIRADEVIKNPDTKLVAIFEQAGEISDKNYEDAKFCTSYDELLEQDINAIFICAYNNVAAEYTIKALNKGYHVSAKNHLHIQLKN